MVGQARELEGMVGQSREGQLGSFKSADGDRLLEGGSGRQPLIYADAPVQVSPICLLLLLLLLLTPVLLSFAV